MAGQPEHQYRELFKKSPQAMWVYDSRSLAFLEVNHAAVRSYGYSRPEFLALNLKDILVGQDLPAVTEPPGMEERKHRRKDGTLLDVEVSCFNLEFNGQPATLMLSIDITERKRAEAQVRIFSELGRRLSAVRTPREAAKSVLEAADLLFGWDACLFNLCSPDQKKVTDVISIDTIRGQRVDLPGGESVPGPLVSRTMAQGAQLILRAVAEFPAGAMPFGDGARASASIMTVLIRKDADPIGTLSIHSYKHNAYSPEDLRVLQALADHCGAALERIRAEREILRLNSELERRVTERTAQLQAMNRELEAFSYSVSHDLRAPLRSIRGFSEVLMERYAGQLDERGLEFLRRSCESSQRMDRLIDDLLKLSRVNRSELQHQAVDLSRLAGEIGAELRKADPARQVELSVQPGLRAQGDERLLRVMLDNLLRNAWKFTSRKTQASIEFGAHPEPDPVFFVRDNGAGFDMKYAAKLFGVFQRLHTVAEFPGTGIGLATVQRIVNRHGGRIWAEGVPGEGATFYFSLPAPKVI